MRNLNKSSQKGYIILILIINLKQFRLNNLINKNTFAKCC